MGTAVSELLQFGALGLCALMIVQQFLERREMSREMDRKSRAIEDLLRQNTAAMNQLGMALQERPCLLADSRARLGTGGDMRPAGCPQVSGAAAPQASG